MLTRLCNPGRIGLRCAQYPLLSGVDRYQNAPITVPARSLSTVSTTGRTMLTRRNKFSQIQQNQQRDLLLEVGTTVVFIGMYHLASERSSMTAQKPHYEQPYECGFNQLGGVAFAGYTFLIWIFLLFELEIIMLLLTPTFDVAMPMFLAFLFATWTWIWVIPTTTNF